MMVEDPISLLFFRYTGRAPAIKACASSQKKTTMSKKVSNLKSRVSSLKAQAFTAGSGYPLQFNGCSLLRWQA